MAGELWLQELRAGVESVYGTAVVPTRRLYWAADSGLQPGGSTTRHVLQTGDRAQVRSATPGVQAPSGTFSLPVSSDEILELLHIGVDGDPAITTPAGGTNARLHVYTAPNALASMTAQWFDGARPWQASGIYANTLRLTGNPGEGGTNILSGDLFAASMTQTALTGTVTDRTPLPMEGWEAQLFIDPVSGSDDYGTTLIAAAQSVVNWDLPIAQNNLGRLYTAANTRAMQAAIVGPLELTGSLTFVASGARSLTEYNDFVAGTQKRIRLRFGDNEVIEGALTYFVDVDIPIVWTEFDLLNETAGVRTYAASFGYLFDAANDFAIRVRCQGIREEAF